MNKMWIIRCIALLAAVSAFPAHGRAQYYYKDIVVTEQINHNYQLLRNNKVAQVTVNPSGLGPENTAVTLQQTVSAERRLVTTYTKVPDATESWLKSYYSPEGRLIRSVDSSAEVVTTSQYSYGADNRLSSISSRSVPVNDPAETEVHSWTYNGNGQPVRMVKVKDNTDTTIVTFTADEQGNPGEENATRKNGNVGTYYYYFDAQHRLTDVARFNKRANRILPDYMFEYNDGIQLSQMIIVPEGSADYQTWKYSYNAQGLKTKEDCYSKQKQLVASVVYNYQTGR